MTIAHVLEAWAHRHQLKLTHSDIRDSDITTGCAYLRIHLCDRKVCGFVYSSPMDGWYSLAACLNAYDSLPGEQYMLRIPLYAVLQQIERENAKANQ